MISAAINSIRDLAAVARGRRLELRMSQEELADLAGVSRQWVSGFEAGKPGAELQLTIRLLDALGLRLAVEEEAHGQPSEPGGIDLDRLLDEHREP